MRHDWIFDVLSDLLSYSQKNSLPALANRVEDALRVARAELAPPEPEGQDGGSHGPMPHSGRRH
ncbi:MAG: hypothetical protein U1D06_00970 [Paracoccaceae bacterium]|nr:hypothetical protein [Paracoccaceae bacterium]